MIIVKNRKKITDNFDKNEWGTPQYLFEPLNKIFNFTIDLCATETNKKLDRYYDKEQNSLLQNWDNEIGFLNPPYGRGLIEPFLKKANEARNSIIVALIPAAVSELWWWNTVQGIALAYPVKRRVKFEGAKSSAGFGNVIAVYNTPGDISCPVNHNHLTKLRDLCEHVHDNRKAKK